MTLGIIFLPSAGLTQAHPNKRKICTYENYLYEFLSLNDLLVNSCENENW